MEFMLRTRVYLEDTDAQGIVYYVNYLKFMERARTEFLRSIGFDFHSLQQAQGHFVVHSVDVRYLISAKVDDLLQVSASIVKAARTYVVFRQEVRRVSEATGGDDCVLCTGNIKVACVGIDSGRPMVIPALIADAFTQQCKN